ncbi:MAG: oxidoreductase, partial [Citromicrobium sp.]|nr:oxidoreductase [Citromicrobium sp.]
EYCEDCDVAELADAENPSRYDKVQPYAVDADSAERLWAMSEEMAAGV